MRLKTFSKKKKKKSVAQIATGAFVSVGMCVRGGGGVVSREEEERGCNNSPSHFRPSLL